MVIVLMGVTGAGKTIVGRQLAASLGADFYDADDFHSSEAIAKMQAGIPLDDADRMPWLARLTKKIHEVEAARQTAVLACSALKQKYREQLRAAATSATVPFVYLRITKEMAASRLRERRGHYMPPSLVESQFATLEEPTDAIEVDGQATPESLVVQIRRALKLDRTN